MSALLAVGLTAAGPAVGATARPIRASLSAVSCKGALWCMAVGSYTDQSQARHALAQVWNVASWRTLKNPPGRALTSVSCSSPRFCMAAGGPTGAELWNGTTWRTMKSPPGGVSGVSCGSRTTCMVIDGSVNGGVVESWNGSKWRIWKQATNACDGAPGTCGLADVSCGSATNCMAVGTWTISQEPVQPTIGFGWNGVRWARTSPPGDGNPAALNAISCAGSFCMAAGGAFQEVQNGAVAVAGTWNASTQSWQDVSPNLGVLCTGFRTCFWAGVISCGSPTNCIVFGHGGTLGSGNLAWNGVTWAPAPSVSAGRGSNLGAVSCAGRSCLAVGYRTIAGAIRPLAELWNGTSWQILKTPIPG